MGYLLRTQGTMGLLRQTRKRLGFFEALAWWLDELGWLLRCNSASAGLDVVQHDA